MAQTNYKQQHWNRQVQKYRVYLGISQMFHMPWLNLFLIPIFIVSVAVWKAVNWFLSSWHIPQLLVPLYKYLSIIIIVLIPFLLLFCLIECVAFFTARKTEAVMEKVFSSQVLHGYYPILMHKRKVKGCDVTEYIFYSEIPKEIWIAKKKFIASSMNIHFAVEIDYYKNDGRMIIMKVSPGIAQAERELLYDDQF